MIKLFSYCIFILFVSCGTLKSTQSKSKNDNAQLAEVDVGDFGGEKSANQSPVLSPPVETIRIGENGGNVYAQNEMQIAPNEDQVKRARIGLSFGPSLYRSLNYVSVLKSFEKNKIIPKAVTGTEFGAVVAAMYAMGMTPEVIEWNFYKYFKEKRNYRLYSNDWLEELDTLLLEKFKDKKIQETNKKFYITLYNPHSKKTYFFDKGNIRELLNLNFRLSSSVKNISKSSYTTAMESEVFNAKLMKKVGTDFVIGVDGLSTKFDFEDSNEFLIGIYGKVSGQIAKEKKSFDYFITLPLSSMSLDTTENVSQFMLNSEHFSETQIPLIKKNLLQKFSPSPDVLEN